MGILGEVFAPHHSLPCAEPFIKQGQSSLAAVPRCSSPRSSWFQLRQTSASISLLDVPSLSSWIREMRHPAFLVKFSKARCKVLHLDWGNPRHKHRMGVERMESSPEEKGLGVLMDKRERL